MNAPSAGNQQPWRFIVVRDRQRLDRVPAIHPHSAMLTQAPLAIVVCGEPGGAKWPEYWPQDCSAATENILVEAQLLGLGAVWLGVYPLQERMRPLRELFGLPDDVELFAMVAVGFPAEQKPPAERYDATRIHRDRW
jgi:nitroreductase